MKIMNTSTVDFQYVDYLWDDNKAETLNGDEVALFLYRSNILDSIYLTSLIKTYTQ